MTAALIPTTNSLLAIGLVAIPGMMTGQVLAGEDPLTAARYQIMGMAMIDGSAALALVAYFLPPGWSYARPQLFGSAPVVRSKRGAGPSGISKPDNRPSGNGKR